MVKPSRGNAPSTSLFLLFCNCQKTDETKSVNQTKPKNPPSPQPKSRPSNQFSRLPQGRNSQSPAAVPPSLVRRFIRPSTQTSQHPIVKKLKHSQKWLILLDKFTFSGFPARFAGFGEAAPLGRSGRIFGPGINPRPQRNFFASAALTFGGLGRFFQASPPVPRQFRRKTGGKHAVQGSHLSWQSAAG